MNEPMVGSAGRTAKDKFIGTALMLVSTMIWGSSFVVTKDLVSAVPTIFLVAFRNFFGGVAVLAVLWKKARHIDFALLWRGCILGVLFGAGMLLQTYGVQYSTPGKTAFLTASYCVMMPFLEWLVLKNRPEGKSVLAAVCGLIGIGLVALTERFTVQFGDLLTLAASVSFAFQILLMSIFLRKYDSVCLNVVQLIASGVLLFILSFAVEPLPARMTPPMIWRILYLSIGCTAIPMVFQGFAMERLSPTVITILLGFEGVFAVLFSALLYGETFTTRCIIGFLLIFSAVLISELSLPKRKDKPGRN